ncbi:MAG: DEAD/DEAH box helicase [Gemmatimonadales bacterium]|nr:MAG: DEAD/DEAH box helicase [Gemmatimonadales bacterium]
MTRSSSSAPAVDTFQEMDLAPELLRALGDMGFEAPTPIQQQAVVPGIQGRDLLACAMTGSGKTVAFLLPVLQRLRERPAGTTRALVLTPTRELAAQVAAELDALTRHLPLRGAAIFGGVAIGPQERAFRRGVDVLVATPGRLLDHLQYDYASLAQVEFLVLDEADRMLDMGFLPDIRRVLGHLPSSPRQTLFVSATMPPPIVQLSRELLRDPLRIDVERKQAPATGVTQTIFPVPAHRKPALLVELLRRDEIGNVIAFCRTKHRANRLFEVLEKAGVPASRIHGNRSQAQRTKALQGFRDGRFRVLCATDIVARGIDVEALDHVVNFDVPAQAEDYIHRVGRTARAGATGEAYTFVSPEEEGELRAIERAVSRKIERRMLDGFDYGAREVERFEIPMGERIKAIREERKKARERQKAKEVRRAEAEASKGKESGSSSGRGQGGGQGGGRRRRGGRR